MHKLINEIKETSLSKSEVVGNIPKWITYCRKNNISLMGLEFLLNFYIDKEKLQNREDSEDGFVSTSEMSLNIQELIRKVEDLEKENESLRKELASLKARSSKKKWFVK